MKIKHYNTFTGETTEIELSLEQIEAIENAPAPLGAENDNIEPV